MSGRRVLFPLLLLASVSCGDPGREWRPSAVLITLDTTNARALDVYGEDREVTPNLAAFAQECIVYDWARTVAPITVTAHASMLT
ncbi:MAG: hypothetical protein V3T22_06460, partial [Planctomycetota bacterium]